MRLGGARATQVEGATGRQRLYRVTRKLHRWLGLSSAAWLFVLALSGIVLTHPDWGWPHRLLIPGLAAPESRQATHAHDRLPRLSLDVRDPARRVVGGPLGLYFTGDAGANWSAVGFAGRRDAPQVFGLVTDPIRGWQATFIATDDGIWRLAPGGDSATRFALYGLHVSALSRGATDNQLLGAVSHSAIFRLDVARPQDPSWIDLRSAQITGLPAYVSLNRYGFDLHLGIGFFAIPFSRLINDVASVAFGVLALTGFLYWYLPRRWRRTRGIRTARSKRLTIQWLFRSHAVISGVVVIVPLLYLSATGIFLDHKLWFQRWSERLPLQAQVSTGNYGLRTLSGEVLGIAPGTSGPNALRMLTRLGFLHSDDGGRVWRFDTRFPLNLAESWTRVKLHVLPDMQIAAELVARNHYARPGTEGWWPLPKIPGYYVLDAQQIGEQLYLRTYAGLVVGDLARGFEVVPFTLPSVEGLDFAYLMRAIHGLLFFDRKLIWLNDVAAVFATGLMLSGLYNWAGRRTKWV